jgi:excinuclease ABC subunit B
MDFELVSDYEPRGDQPQAIEKLAAGVKQGREHQVLLGVTGSGKTFTMANVIERVQKPTLIISHNKTLAAQLYGEFKQFFPRNAVEYFVSYYDYYQPEAYVPQTDTYIEKDASINDDIERLRLRATSALLERRDVIIVASVSCIYNLGSPDEWREYIALLARGQRLERDELLRRLVEIQYTRNDIEFARGTFRVRGDVVEIRPADQETGVRVEYSGDEISRLAVVDPLTGRVLEDRDTLAVYPGKHFLVNQPRLEAALRQIERELKERLQLFQVQGKLLEAQRLANRTRYDLEMIRELGYCPGIENYSRHLAGRAPGERPFCLLDFFPRDFLLIIDESHATIPQIGGMFGGDRSRKQTLVDYGFRLPSALDNRPLRFEEFTALLNQVVYVSATPAAYEIEKTAGLVVEQIIRPTGLVDPRITLKPAEGQVDDLIAEVRRRVERKQRVLVTTLTKRMAEDLADYLQQLGIRVRYLHSEIDAIERVGILRGLRLADFDVLVGVNLLREGLDLPEVSLVAILDADKEGFLRSERSLIQTAGRAARNVDGEVVMYAEVLTDSIRRAVEETNRRRDIQMEYNRRMGITPRTIYKSVEEILRTTAVADTRTEQVSGEVVKILSLDLDRDTLLEQLEREMRGAAAVLDFEKAAILRDEIARLKGDAGSPPGGGSPLSRASGSQDRGRRVPSPKRGPGRGR